MEHKAEIAFRGKTDIGQQRTNNEDAFVAQFIWDKSHVLAVAVDGVGGYDGGEVAAQIAQQTIVEYLERYPNGERLDLLKQAVIFANNSIVEERKKQENVANMSCVLSAVLIEAEQQRINMVHVGDTRVYLYHLDELKKLSHDHSLIGYREEIGALTEDEAMSHPQRNIINRDVGSAQHEISDRDFLESATFPLYSGSTILLCSDGLSDMITRAQMKYVLQKECSLEEKTKELIDTANAAGGKDNITVVLVEYVNDEIEEISRNTETVADINPIIEVRESHSVTKKKKHRSVMATIIALIATLLIGAIIGWFAHEKHNLEGMPDIETRNVIVPDSLRIIVKDSFMIINDIDTLPVQDKMSVDLNGVWIKTQAN